MDTQCQVYQYNNLLAAAAGYVPGHVLHPTLELGEAYDRARLLAN